METYRLIDWDNITPEEGEERRKLLSRLNVEKIDRDKECREKWFFLNSPRQCKCSGF